MAAAAAAAVVVVVVVAVVVAVVVVVVAVVVFVIVPVAVVGLVGPSWLIPVGVASGPVMILDVESDKCCCAGGC